MCVFGLFAFQIIGKTQFRNMRFFVGGADLKGEARRYEAGVLVECIRTVLPAESAYRVFGGYSTNAPVTMHFLFSFYSLCVHVSNEARTKTVSE